MHTRWGKLWREGRLTQIERHAERPAYGVSMLPKVLEERWL